MRAMRAHAPVSTLSAPLAMPAISIRAPARRAIPAKQARRDGRWATARHGTSPRALRVAADVTRDTSTAILPTHYDTRVIIGAASAFDAIYDDMRMPPNYQFRLYIYYIDCRDRAYT